MFDNETDAGNYQQNRFKALYTVLLFIEEIPSVVAWVKGQNRQSVGTAIGYVVDSL